MKRNINSILIVLAIFFGCNNSYAFDIQGVLGKVLNNDSTSTSAISGVIGSVLGTDKVELKDLVGTWKYEAPAVSFKSDNLLQKAGGAAAASAIEAKILPIYQRSGITNLKLEVTNDSTFTFTVKRITSKGKITKDENGDFVFIYQALGKDVATMTAYITKSSSNQIAMTFDASKLITLVETIAKYSNNTTLKTASTLLNSYDGVTVGFKLKK
ncbi:MAG: lipocalin-like domain-containing protein [Muribaculaceae bacterium]